jgi:hypothetical protein
MGPQRGCEEGKNRPIRRSRTPKQGYRRKFEDRGRLRPKAEVGSSRRSGYPPHRFGNRAATDFRHLTVLYHLTKVR